MASCTPPQNTEGIGGYPVSPTGEGLRRPRPCQGNRARRVLLWAALLTSVSLLSVPAVRAQSLLEASRLRSSSPLPLTQESLAQAMQARAAEEPNVVIVPPETPKPKVEQGPSRIERLLSRELRPDVSLDLKQFGYDVFRMPVTTFAPVTNVPVGPDYVIGPGDSFTLTLWGRVDAQYTLRVDRNGQIVLPEVGALRVWGMKFAELESYLQHELSRKYADFKMSVTMDRLRSIRVFVVGEALTPGSYTISSLSTAINALFAAGGPSKSGSLRSIRLLRNGADPCQVDLYDFLLGGDKTGDLRLQDGDTIFIPLIGPVAGVAGNVKRPAIYEMAASMTLAETLDLAGGVTFTGWLQRVQVERVEQHRRRVVVDFDISRDGDLYDRRAADVTLQDGDVVKVFAVPSRQEKVVHLAGHVVRPGTYEWKPGLRLGDLLASYDDLQAQPNLAYGEIERLIPPDLHPITIPFNVGRLLAGEPGENLELRQYDTVRLFRWDERISEAVRISGLVFDPNQYRLVPDMRVSDLVDTAGGLRKNAYLRNAEITRRHVTQQGMTSETIDVDLEKALAGDPEHNLLLRDYDHLVIRPIPELEFDRSAEILGEVRFPGTYPIRKGEQLSSLIERAGGFTGEAYLRGAVFARESAREVQRRRLDQLIRQVEESVLAGSEQRMSGALDAETVKSQQVALETKQQLLAKLRAAELTGRVVVKLVPVAELRGSPHDLELEDGDTLTVPQMPGVVHVVGEVFNATSLLYEQGRTVGYYLRKVGGMTKEAEEKQVSVIKADGSVISREQGNKGKLVFWDSEHSSWFFGGFMSLEMEPGDTIVVPRDLDRFLWIRTTKDITQIIFQIAVAAGIAFAI